MADRTQGLDLCLPFTGGKLDRETTRSLRLGGRARKRQQIPNTIAILDSVKQILIYIKIS